MQYAQPIFAPVDSREPGIFCCYRADLALPESEMPDSVQLRITGRSYYRLYVNGVFVMHGPARTARGYLRVDELELRPHLHAGQNAVAIEQMSFGDAFNSYSNDLTLEDGLLLFEIAVRRTPQDAYAVQAYSCAETPCRLLSSRASRAERKTHCREASEIWFLDASYGAWRTGPLDGFTESRVLAETPQLLPRRVPYPDLACKSDFFLENFGSFTYDGAYEPTFYEKPLLEQYKTLPERLLPDLARVRETAGDAAVRYIPGGAAATVRDRTFLAWSLPESFVGFIGFRLETDADLRVDLVATELLNTDGSIRCDYNPGTRLHVRKGTYEFLSFDPRLLRYVRFYLTAEDGPAHVTVSDIHIRTFSIPDTREGFFTCSDEDVNRLYRAARKTLLLNTLDIFMDCPDRERGGWLCDSFWTARACALLLGDTAVETAFLENFLLTDPALYRDAFFPSVYPGLEPGYPAPQIATWSFWFLAELCEYVRRTGDDSLIRAHADRIEAFIDGALALRGESGLLENLPIVFIDGSQSNRPSHVGPISVPANALFAYALREYGLQFGMPQHVRTAETLFVRLRDAILPLCREDLRIPDSLVYEKSCESWKVCGRFRSGGRWSEAAHCTDIWCGLLGFAMQADPGSVPHGVKWRVVEEMGPASKYKPDPDVDRSALFIGLEIRFDMLARLGLADTMMRELRAVYDVQLREGPGTLWEHEIIRTTSRCHGFGSHAGYLLTCHILGLHAPDEQKKHIVIAPNPGALRFAKGSARTQGGCVCVAYVCDRGRFTLHASVPKGYTWEVQLPPCVQGLGAENISVHVSEAAG